MSAAEDELAMQLRAAKIEFTREFRFAHPRRWRADFRIGADLLVEVQGGTWMGGKHTRGKGYADDCERLNAAVLLDYRVLWVTPEHIRTGEALRWVERACER